MGETTQFGIPVSALQQLLQNMREKAQKARKSKRMRWFPKSILKDLNPLVKEIKQYNDDLDRPSEEVKALIKENDAGKDAPCCKCFSLTLWLEKFFSWWHSWNNDSFDAVDKQALKDDVKETLHQVREILELLSREDFEKRLNRGPVKRPCGVPKKPGFTVGLDEPLRKLKAEILRDGVSILVLTGLGGSGKTTLATKLCWDEQVKGKCLILFGYVMPHIHNLAN